LTDQKQIGAMEKEKNEWKAESSKHSFISFKLTYILVHQFPK